MARYFRSLENANKIAKEVSNAVHKKLKETKINMNKENSKLQYTEKGKPKIVVMQCLQVFASYFAHLIWLRTCTKIVIFIKLRTF